MEPYYLGYCISSVTYIAMAHAIQQRDKSQTHSIIIHYASWNMLLLGRSRPRPKETKIARPSPSWARRLRYKPWPRVDIGTAEIKLISLSVPDTILA